MILLSIEEAIVNWMATHVPHLLSIALLVVAAVWTTIIVMRLKARFLLTEQACDNLSARLVPDLHKKYSGIDTKLNTVLISISKISTFLITEKGLSNNIFEAKSPLELTDIGFKILDQVGGRKYVDDHQYDLIIAIEAKAPKSGLDVQNYAYSILTDQTQDDSFTFIKNYIFQNPVYHANDTWQFNLELATVIQIMGIYLRNKYFDKYPDLKSDL